MSREKKFMYFVLQILVSLMCSWVFVTYIQISNTSIIVFLIALIFCYLQSYAREYCNEFRKHKIWYLIFSLGISVTLIACKHIVIQFYDFFSGIQGNYILEYTLYDLFAFVVLVYIFVILEISLIKFLSLKFIVKKTKDNAVEESRKVGIKNVKQLFIYTGIIIVCWMPYLILYYPGFIYGDSTNSLNEVLGKAAYSNVHPFMFTMFIKFCFYLGNMIGGGNTAGCLIYSLVQIFYMGGIFAYSICWLRNKNISKKMCFIVLLFFALPRFWGQHAISMWKDPVFAVSVYFYSLKLFDLIYSKGEVSKDKKYILQCVISILLICFSRNNGIYVAVFCLMTLVVCCFFGKNKCIVKKGFILATSITILFSWIIQGPVYKHFGITGSAAGAYGIPLQQVARTVVYNGNISEEEKQFLNDIMPLEKYANNYCPGLVDTLKWSADFNSEFFGTHYKEFLQVWLSLMVKNPKLYIEAWAMETCGFWGVGYWRLNNYLSNSSMGVPREHDFLKAEYDINYDSLLKKYSSLDETLKSYYAIETPIPAVALCLWISLFMTLYVIVNEKWKYLLAFCPSFGVIATLLIATPIAYWPRYGLSSICLVPISLLFPYLIMERNEKCEEIASE